MAIRLRKLNRRDAEGAEGKKGEPVCSVLLRAPGVSAVNFAPEPEGFLSPRGPEGTGDFPSPRDAVARERGLRGEGQIRRESS
jgi:hypothetical protein